MVVALPRDIELGITLRCPVAGAALITWSAPEEISPFDGRHLAEIHVR
jgi:hypothetical protein